MPRTVAVVHAGLRTPSTTGMLADTLTQAVRDAFSARGEEATVFTVELRHHAHAMMDALLTGFAAGDLADDLDVLKSADALVVVTPTYQASYSGLFKCFFDLVEPGALTEVPVLLGATGGTERHSLVIDHALRPLFAHLAADPVRTGVFAATSDFGSTEGAVSTRAARAASELVTRVLGRPTAMAPTTADLEATEAASAGLVEVEDFESMMARMGLKP